jgi:hypothetical protein
MVNLAAAHAARERDWFRCRACGLTAGPFGPQSWTTGVRAMPFRAAVFRRPSVSRPCRGAPTRQFDYLPQDAVPHHDRPVPPHRTAAHRRAAAWRGGQTDYRRGCASDPFNTLLLVARRVAQPGGPEFCPP